MVKMLRLFEGKKQAPETSHDKLTKYGWERMAGTHPANGPHHTYVHSEHPGHSIEFNKATGHFIHKVHHSHDLEKHLGKHQGEHEKTQAALRDWQHSQR
jgi:hypothetical protein